MKEGNVINKSLSTLGKVISVLADRGKSGKRPHVPYRDSVLTWLLKESIGGNSKTIMLAAISPAAINFDETLSTLRYASKTKSIVNSAVVNEDSKASVVRQLKQEIEQLRAQLTQAQSTGVGMGAGPNTGATEEAAMMQQLEETESLLAELSKSWEEKLQQTLEMQSLRIADLRAHGIVLGDDDDEFGGPVGVMPPSKIPYLLNHSRHTFLQDGQQCLVYYIKEGFTPVNRFDETMDSAVRMRGIVLHTDEPLCEFCVFNCQVDPVSGLLSVTLMPSESTDITVNDRRLHGPTRLHSGDIITIARHNIFRFENPEENMMMSPTTSSKLNSPCLSPKAEHRPPSPTGTATSANSASPTNSPRSPSIDSLDQAQFAFEFSEYTSILQQLAQADLPNHEFPLLPAYSSYLLLRFCCHTYSDAELRELLSAIASFYELQSESLATFRARVFWMANTVELLMALRLDALLCQAATQTSFIAQFTSMVEDSYAAVVFAALDLLRPVLASFFELGADGEPRVCSPADLPLLSTLTDIGVALEDLLGRNEAVQRQIHEAIFFGIGALLFNYLVAHTSLYTCQTGLQISLNISTLLAWAHTSQFRLDVAHYLRHLTQAALLFQTRKGSLDDLPTLTEACSVLNSVQLRHLLTHATSNDAVPSRSGTPTPSGAAAAAAAVPTKFGRSSVGASRQSSQTTPTPTPGVPAEVISCMTAMAKAGADKRDLDDERASCQVQLERNARYLLPFRLHGDFSMKLGLVRWRTAFLRRCVPVHTCFACVCVCVCVSHRLLVHHQSLTHSQCNRDLINYVQTVLTALTAPSTQASPAVLPQGFARPRPVRPDQPVFV
jgi:hypothetical protein